MIDQRFTLQVLPILQDAGQPASRSAIVSFEKARTVPKKMTDEHLFATVSKPVISRRASQLRDS